MTQISSFFFYFVGLSIIFTWYVIAIYDAKLAARKRHMMAKSLKNEKVFPSLMTAAVYSHQTLHSAKEKELELRKHILTSECESFHKARKSIKIPSLQQESTRAFYYSKVASLTVCKAPKTGCSLVSKLFFTIEPKMSVVKAVSMDRYEVQGGAYEYDEDFIFDNQRSGRLITAVVARNPYERLFSVYLDKVYIIGELNNKFGQELKSAFHVTSDEICGYEISFQGFLDTVITMASYDEYENDWLPVSDLCIPCHMKYDIICKTETLDSDLNHVMMKSNLTVDKISTFRKFIQKEKRKKSFILSQVKATISRHSSYDSVCPKTLDLMEKTWVSLQMRGYIHEKSSFPRVRFLTRVNGKFKVGRVNENDFVDIVNEEFSSRPMHPKQMSYQRHKYLVKAYSQIKRQTISNLQKLYKYDFLFFNYSLEPPGLYTGN